MQYQFQISSKAFGSASISTQYEYSLNFTKLVLGTYVLEIRKEGIEST